MKCWPSSSSRDAVAIYTSCPEEESSSDSEGGFVKEFAARKEVSKESFTENGCDETRDLQSEVVSTVGFEEDMYDSVTVAAFGGVVLQLPGGSIRVHPMWMFLLSCLLFLAQQAALLYLRLGQDLDSPVHGEGVEEELKRILPFAKVLMIYTMALMLFPELLDSLRLMMFLVNPTTWTDMKRIDMEHRKFMPWIWSGWFVGPLSFISEMMKFCIGYMVLVDSVSIVLASSSVQDAIFNSLALSFLVDLDNQLWTVVKSVFHLNFRIEKFDFRPPKQRQEANKKAWLRIPENCWLHRLHGAAELEACTTSLIFTFLYCRQFLVTEYSLRTDTLPMARDMCTIWKMTQQNSWFGALFRNGLGLISLHDHPNGMLNHMCNPSLGGYCTERFRRIMLQDMYELIMESPIATVTNMVTFAIILLIPQIFQLFWVLRDGNSKHSIWMVCPEVDEEPQGTDEKQELRAEVQRLDSELKKVTEMVNRSNFRTISAVTPGKAEISNSN